MNSQLSNYMSIFIGVGLIVLIGLVVRRQIMEYHLQDDPMLYTLKRLIEPLHPVVKNLKLYKGDKSYTINKDKIFMCLKDKNGEYYPLNMLLYVLIHELAHRVNDFDVGHTPKFYEIFEQLLQQATELGIYNPSIPVIQNYCNH